MSKNLMRASPVLFLTFTLKSGTHSQSCELNKTSRQKRDGKPGRMSYRRSLLNVMGYKRLHRCNFLFAFT
jgi:hypothetical protein